MTAIAFGGGSQTSSVRPRDKLKLYRLYQRSAWLRTRESRGRPKARLETVL